MKVGGVAETITVTGETPVVDVTSARTQQTLSGETVSNIPSSRQYSAFTQLIPAINAQGNDVGGALGPIFSVFQVHGGRRNEGQVLVDGMSAGFQGMGVSSYVPEVANPQEVIFSISGGLGEAMTGGPQMNIVGKTHKLPSCEGGSNRRLRRATSPFYIRHEAWRLCRLSLED